jgi:hypothetical protein
MSDSIEPQLKHMSELLIILNYEVSHERPCKTSLYNSVLSAGLLWRIMALFNKNRIKKIKRMEGREARLRSSGYS